MVKSKILFLSLFSLLLYANTKYEPDWDSLDTRPIPSWYNEAKIGILLHWGVFSVPSFGSEWFWADWKTQYDSPQFEEYMGENFAKFFSYQEFAKEFTAELFNPDDWAKLFKDSGAKYVVLTSKHHEGYTLWPSTYSYSWNSMDMGPHRDLVGVLSVVLKEAGLTFGTYYSLYEWFNPMYLSDRLTDFEKNEYITCKVIPEMKELVISYRPEILWSDGDWEANDTYWNSTEFIAWLYNESPVKDTIVVNDRWGIDIPEKHGDFYTSLQRFNPDEREPIPIVRHARKFEGTLQKHKWENLISLDKYSWGFRRNAPLSDYLTTQELLQNLAATISCGGNFLINVGPTKEGVIIPIMEERLLDMGKWLETNGDAIFGTHPWTHQNDSTTSNIWYTEKSGVVYAIISDWPSKNNTLTLGSPGEIFVESKTIVELIGFKGSLEWNKSGSDVTITFPNIYALIKKPAWVLMIKN